MSIIFISKAVIGQEYLSKDAQGVWKNRVKVSSIGSSQSGLSVFVPGYGFQKPIMVSNSVLLSEMTQAKSASKEDGMGKKVVKVKGKLPLAPKKKDEVKTRLVFMAGSKEKVERKMLPKVPKGELAPFIKVDGYRMRANYRIHMSAERVRQCEGAEHEVCHCRCGGLLHGKSHAKMLQLENALFIKHHGVIPGAVYLREVIYKLGGKPKVKKS